MSEELKLYQSIHEGPSFDTAVSRVLASGIGDYCTIITDWNTATKNGWYKTTTYDENNHGPSPLAWYGHVTAYSASLIVQEAWHINNALSCDHWIRWYYQGGWQPWECVSPLMEMGKEYRTTERYYGKPVYQKLINFGTLPNNTTKSVAHGVENLLFCIRASVTLTNGAYVTDWFGITSVFVENTNFSITTEGDRSVYSAYGFMAYTKKTD